MKKPLLKVRTTEGLKTLLQLQRLMFLANRKHAAALGRRTCQRCGKVMKSRKSLFHDGTEKHKYCRPCALYWGLL